MSANIEEQRVLVNVELASIIFPLARSIYFISFFGKRPVSVFIGMFQCFCSCLRAQSDLLGKFEIFWNLLQTEPKQRQFR